MYERERERERERSITLALPQVRFRNAVAGTEMSNWYQEGDNVAFSRGDKGFFAMSKWGSFDKTLQTGE